MKRSDFISLRDHILSMNEYFNSGYDLVIKDSEDGILYYEIGDKRKIVFPDDTNGNYFFMVLDGQIKFDSRNSDKINDCGGKVYSDQSNLILVCVVRDADEWSLLANMRNTIAKFKGFTLTVSGAQLDREEVVYNIMKNTGEQATIRALSRMKNETIISLTINASKNFIPNGCIVDVCKNC